MDPSFTFHNYCNFVFWVILFFVTNRDNLNFEHWIQKWFKHFSQIVNNSKTFLKTSHTHSLSFYFLIFQIATKRRKRAYLFKDEKLKETKAWFYSIILSYPILLGNIKIVQVYAYFQWRHFRRSDSSMLIPPTNNITLWMLGYERSTSLEIMVPRIVEVWNDVADWW